MATVRIVAAHETDPEHLADVIERMRDLGAPRIRAVEGRGMLLAIEGTHRLAAADALGLAPVVEVMGEDDCVPEDNDVDDGAFRGLTAGAIRDYLLSGDGPTGASYWVEL